MLLKIFNRSFTIIKLSKLGTPKSALLTEIELPRNSAFHFMTDNGTVVGPPQTIPFLSKLEKVAQVEHITAFIGSSQIGRPKLHPYNVTKATAQFHRNNKGLRRMRDTRTVERDERALYVINYSPLRHIYVYPENMMSWYQKWSNIFDTAVRKIDSIAYAYERNNYLVLDIPDKLPSVASFKLAEKAVNREVLADFADERLLLMLDLWKWCGKTASTSSLNIIDSRSYSKVNILLTYKERFINLNLGELWFWKNGGKDNPGPLDPLQLQLRVYSTIRKLMIHSMDIPVEGGEDISDTADSVIGKIKPTEEDDTVDDLAIAAKAFETEGEELEKADAFEVVHVSKEPSDVPTVARLNVASNYTDGLIDALDYHVEHNIVSTKEYKYFQDNAAKYKDIANPYGDGKLTELLLIKPEELVLKSEIMFDDPTILDKSILTTVTKEWDKKYNENILKKDIAACIVSVQRAGVILKDYKVSSSLDASGGQDTHTFTLQPIGGAQSTHHQVIPSIDEEGYWRANDVSVSMRKQKTDLPIRKVKSDTVAITSFYGKNFILRNEYAVNNYSLWLTNNLVAYSLEDGSKITDVVYASKLNTEVRLPRDYTSISERLSSFKFGGYTFNLDYDKIEELFDKDTVSKLGKSKLIPIASGKSGIIAMDDESIIYSVKGEVIEDIGKLDSFIGLPTDKAPKEFSELSMMGKAIPLAIAFCYFLGLEKAFKLFGVKYSAIEPNTRYSPERTELILKLSDVTIICELDTEVRRLLFQGLGPYIKLMRAFSLRDMNEQDVYLNLIKKNGLTDRYLKELVLMNDLFIDPITERLLLEMPEPTTFKGLLMRSNEMLTYDQHKDEVDITEQHIYGNQRIAGALYLEIVRSVRTYRNKPGAKRMEMSPNQTWMAIASDRSVMISQDHNPIQLIKERSVVTSGGTGGRQKRSMVKKTRKYYKEDIGIISEANVDSGDVGITTYLSASPQLANVDGIVKGKKDLTAASMLSSCVLNAPGSFYDDGKRMSFITNQAGSGIAADGYVVPPYRTGFEKTIAHRTSNKMAIIAEGDGKVKEITDTSITVEYEGKPKVLKTYPLGKYFGQYEGSTFPHNNVNNFKRGVKFNKGAVLTYNEGFFEPDLLNTDQVNWKAGVMVKVALLEGTDEIEDSSAISIEIADKLRSDITKVVNVVGEFGNAILDLVSVGDKVTPETILCTIEDKITAVSGTFKDESITTMRALSAQTPRAEDSGVIDKIEIFYNGDYEDMSESVLGIAKMGDKGRRKLAKASDKTEADNGRVDSTLRINGRGVELDTIIIRIYITVSHPAKGGDKAVFGNQMKTTFRRVMTGINETKSGLPIGARFGRVSVDARMVISFFKIGTTCKVCELISADNKRILDEEK